MHGCSRTREGIVALCSSATLFLSLRILRTCFSFLGQGHEPDMDGEMAAAHAGESREALGSLGSVSWRRGARREACRSVATCCDFECDICYFNNAFTITY